MTKEPEFIHLHCHSQYSILDATGSVVKLAKHASSLNMPALALTDHGNLYGAVDFYKACLAHNTKPIIGCELYVSPGSRTEKTRVPGQPAAYHVTLLAKNQIGYQNLCKLSSIGFLEGFYYYPRVDKEVLEEYSEGLICLSGCLRSSISETVLSGTEQEIEEEINWFRKSFGEDFFFELMRHPILEENQRADGFFQETWLLQKYESYIEKQEKVNTKLIEFGGKKGIGLVATNDIHYLGREDWRAHEILLNVQSGEPVEIWEKDAMGRPTYAKPNPKRRTYASHELYFKSASQMAELFQDVPEALSNTLEIAGRCQVELDFKTKHYPVYIPPYLEGKKYSKNEQKKASEEYLWELCKSGLKHRYTEERLEKIAEHYPGKDPMQVVQERLEYEMSIIVPKEMSDYLLIVWDFIHWAKSNGIPVGPGRGSGAGSIVLYLIGITDIEPLRFNLFFERFINPERLSYPDIDVDICMEGRSEVIRYTLEKYGKENIAQIITFGTMKAKMSIRDVGRVLNIPISQVNTIAKLVPDDLNITLDEALQKDPDFKNAYESDEQAHRLIDLAKALEGSIRNTGIHAAGIVICGDPLVEHIPICNAKDSDMPATQYSMKPVEQVGMLKIDFLGLKTLTSIQKCVEAIKVATGTVIDWENLPLEDQKTFELLNQGKTSGIFQLESAGMQELAKKLHLDRFEEILAVTALYRPGPMDMIPSFIHRKHGREPIEYEHPWMKDILSETNGIMIYQEHVMDTARKLANYSLGEGDVLRKAMGKKDRDEMARQRDKFRKGAMENGIDEQTAMLVFDKMEKFAAYGFNKSHACAYSYISYVTAFLKANYPGQWMAALMTCDRDDLSKVGKLINEAKSMGIPMLPPDINEAGDTFTATKEGIRFAITAVKGVGTGVVEALVTERESSGSFKSLYDFMERLDGKKVGKKAIENLVDAGCFDFTKWSRDALRQSVPEMFASATKKRKEKAAGILSLFDSLDDDSAGRDLKEPKVLQKSSPYALLIKEKELLGFFLSGHPMKAYQKILKRLSCLPLKTVNSENEGVFRSAFFVEEVETRFSSRSQKKFAILKISDGGELVEVPIWADLYEEKGHLFQVNRLLYAVLTLQGSIGEKKLSCQWVDDLTKVNEQMVSVCDQAYDQAQSKLKRRQKYNKNNNPKKSEKKEPKMQEEQEVKPLLIRVDAKKLRLKGSYELKRLFTDHPGKSPVTVEFAFEEKAVASIMIDEHSGISLNPTLQKKIEEVPGVVQTS